MIQTHRPQMILQSLDFGGPMCIRRLRSQSWRSTIVLWIPNVSKQNEKQGKHDLDSWKEIDFHAMLRFKGGGKKKTAYQGSRGSSEISIRGVHQNPHSCNCNRKNLNFHSFTSPAFLYTKIMPATACRPENVAFIPKCELSHLSCSLTITSILKYEPLSPTFSLIRCYSIMLTR